MSLFYVVGKTKLHALIEEEVSKVADEAYADGGQALYDSIVVTEKDWPDIDRLMEDALNAFVAREHSISAYSPVTARGGDYYSDIPIIMRLELFLPDFDTSRWKAAITQLDRYVSLYVCAELFQSRRAEKVPVYTERCKGALESAIALLKTRRVSRNREEPLSGYTVVTEINENCTDKQIPSAKAVLNFVNSFSSEPLIAEGFEQNGDYYDGVPTFVCTNGITIHDIIRTVDAGANVFLSNSHARILVAGYTNDEKSIILATGEQFFWKNED